jgi:hypothetical protein
MNRALWQKNVMRALGGIFVCIKSRSHKSAADETMNQGLGYDVCGCCMQTQITMLCIV